ncbi:MAG: histidine--tRNA ligase [Gemmatimonadota bacterium]
MPIQALPGFRDFYPEDFLLRAHIFETWRLVAERYGFEEYDGPPLEPLELYTAKSGEEIVGQLYNFVDKGDRPVALRPEMTPTLARMVAARANGLKKPIRWFSIPQLFRYERQQRGRLREHFQLNCDLIGEPSPLADAEIIALAIDVIRAFGLTEKDVYVRLSDRRVLEALLRRKVPEDKIPRALGFLDRMEKLRKEELESFKSDAEMFAPATVSDVIAVGEIDSRDSLKAALATIPDGESIGAPLLRVFDALGSMGLAGFVQLDFRVVRGLAYYTGTVFEVFDRGKTLRAICGGGRYDSLAGAVGGVDLAAVGFGFGDVVLGELLKDKGLVPTHHSSIDVFIAAITGEDVPHALRLAHQLRDQGYRVEYPLSGGAVGKQMKLADSRNAGVAIVIGPDDRARGEVMVKDLANKTQSGVPLDGVTEALGKLIKNTGE